jgi:hypothetical protein
MKGFKPGNGLVTLTQTDSAATHGQSVACSGAALTADVGNSIAAPDGGTAGVGTRTITVGIGATEAAIFMESGPIVVQIWPAGVWSVPLDITAGNADISLDEVYVCRVNSAGVSQATIASRTGISRALTSTGVITVDLFQENDETASATDRVYIVFVLTNADAGATQAITITPGQTILTPIIKVHRIKVRRERHEGLGQHLTFQARAEFIPPTVELVDTVAAPTFEAKAHFPFSTITGSRDFLVDG